MGFFSISNILDLIKEAWFWTWIYLLIIMKLNIAITWFKIKNATTIITFCLYYA
jgi:hypothetical protein